MVAMFDSVLVKLYNDSDVASKIVINNLYREFILKQRCVVSKKKPVHCHHLRNYGNAGVGIKPPNIYSIPLHFQYHNEIHRIGAKSFCEINNIDLDAVLLELHNKFIVECCDKVNYPPLSTIGA